MAALNSNLEVFTISADLSIFKEIHQCIQQVEDLDLKIDSLINNVGYGASGLADSLPLDTVERAVVTNAMAPPLITQAFLPVIVEIKGMYSLLEQEQRLILCLT